jgi:Tol biopolymer transport system component
VTDSASLHQSPAWSPDGRTLYYVSNEQGTRDVYALAMNNGASAGRTPQRLTTGLGAHSVTVSADGAHMVYAVYATSANVWAIPIPHDSVGTNAAAVQVTSGNQTVEGVRVSGDRKWLVYDSDLSGNSDIYRVALAGGEPEHLTSSPIDEFRGVISPNGNEMAYHMFETGSRNLFLLPLDGGPARQLTRSVGDGLSMANWSPDGNAIAAFNLPRSTVHVLRRDAEGRWSLPRLVATDGWRPEWSPDGRHVVFVTPRSGRIRIVPADSGDPRDVYVPGPNDPNAELATFADNGREIYFKSHDRTDLRASLWSVSVDGGRPRLLVRFDDPERASNRFDFATDGKRFYFTIEDRQSDLRIAELTTR